MDYKERSLCNRYSICFLPYSTFSESGMLMGTFRVFECKG